MATFDYKCTKCDNVQEEVHKISEKPAIKCNICMSDCEKQFTPTTNFVLKGGGFPSQEFRMKDQMLSKNDKMKAKMTDKVNSGEGVTRLSDLSKKN